MCSGGAIAYRARHLVFKLQGKSEVRSDRVPNPKPENVHHVTDPELCEKMGEKYHWRLKEIRVTRNTPPDVACVFDGEQTSFQDMWQDYQD
ncbi:hypothetical protein [Microcoleus sp. S13_B4]|uniref:hypothetical protein n=1 Tax=Microcoleus sp. S13_B4 TaxID=3055408 RepID=UPI002FD13F8B